MRRLAATPKCRLTLVEHRTEPAVPLSVEERSALQRRLPSVRIAPALGTVAGCYDLTPGSWVGIVDLDTLVVEIRPKLPIGQVLFLISYGLDPQGWPAWLEREVALDSDPGLLEAMVPLFVSQVWRATGRGLLHGYRAVEASLLGVRGRLQLDDQVRRRAGTLPPVEVRYDDFTADVEENRLLRAAVRHLLRLPLRARESARSLRALALLFQDVAQVAYDARRLPEIRYTRLNEHYRAAVELARLILRATSVTLGIGEAPAGGFLVDMNQVFEDFVVVALRESLRLDERTFPQGARGRSLRLDHAGALPLRPDLSWWEGSVCRFAGDVKYRRSGPAGTGPAQPTRPGLGDHADLYQLLAYAVAADLPGGLLVYAAHTDDDPQEGAAVSHEVRHAGKRLEVTSMDLRGPPAEILAQIDLLADRIRLLRDLAPLIRAS